MLRGIYGREHAEIIKKGQVSFRDLLSRLLDPYDTGYKYSNFDEVMLREYIQDISKRPISWRKLTTDNLDRLALYIDPLLSYIYLTYFHIVTESTLEWIDNFADGDVYFIYLIPRLCRVSNNILGKSILGREIEYLYGNQHIDIDAFMSKTKGIVNILDGDLARSATLDEAITHSGMLARMFSFVFSRRTEGVNTSCENEFRVVYKTPTFISNGGLYSSADPRLYKFLISGILYEGYCRYDRQLDGSPDLIDIYLRTKSPLVMDPETTLTENLLKNNKVELLPDYKAVDIRNVATNYGFIGDKEECALFVKRWLTAHHLVR